MNNVNFADLLCLVFIHLKLSGHIDWNWWYVLAPIIASIALPALRDLLSKQKGQ